MVYSISGIRFPVVPSVHKSSQLSFHGDRRTASLSFFLNKDSFSRKTLAVKFPHDSDSSSSTITDSDKVLIPRDQDNSSSLTDELETPDITSEDSQSAQNLEDLTLKDENKYNDDEAASSYREVEDGQGSVMSSLVDDINTNVQAEKTSVSVDRKVKIESDEVKPKMIPPPGIGQKIYEIDPFLQAHREHLDFRYVQYKRLREEIDKYEGGLDAFSRGYEKFGFIRSATGITYREWAPGAKSAALIGDFNNWNPNADVMTRKELHNAHSAVSLGKVCRIRLSGHSSFSHESTLSFLCFQFTFFLLNISLPSISYSSHFLSLLSALGFFFILCPMLLVELQSKQEDIQKGIADDDDVYGC